MTTIIIVLFLYIIGCVLSYGRITGSSYQVHEEFKDLDYKRPIQDKFIVNPI